jgi:heme/copper-type cytochrome/quinol oxidase subunit 2
MKSSSKFLKTMFALAALLAAIRPDTTFACAACFGKSDSPLATGMNWGIFTLMAFIGTVLVTIAGFFFYIIRKEMAHAEENAPRTPTEVEA